MKVSLVFLAVLGFVACIYAEDVTFGTLAEGDQLVYSEIHFKKAQLLKVVTEDIRYSTTKTISYISLKDEHSSKKGGTATIIKGGIGKKDVVLHLKSQRGHGFNFLVEIYVH